MSTTPHPSMPQNSQAFLSYAKLALSDLRKHGSEYRMFACLLWCTHVMDWFFGEIGRKEKPGANGAIKTEYKDWNLMRLAFNDLKHGTPNVDGKEHTIKAKWVLEELEWESNDFWNGVAMLGDRPLADVCASFLETFEADVASGKARKVAESWAPIHKRIRETSI